jgi:hypothetical protein
VRGSNEGRRQPQVHLGYYGAAKHYTALHPMHKKGNRFSSFTIHEQDSNLMRLYDDNVDGPADLPADMLYDPVDPRRVKEPHWSRQYPEESDYNSDEDNVDDEDGKGDDKDKGSIQGHSGSSGNSHLSSYKSISNSDDDNGGGFGAAARNQRSMSIPPFGGNRKAPLNLAANALPNPFIVRGPGASPRGARKTGGLFSPEASKNRAVKFAQQDVYDAGFSAPHSRQPPRSPRSALEYLRSPTELRLERKAIRDADKAPDYRTGVPDFGRPLDVKTMPFGVYGGWEEYEPGHEFYPRVAPDYRDGGQRYDDYGRVARRRQEFTTPSPPPYSNTTQHQPSSPPKLVASTARSVSRQPR